MKENEGQLLGTRRQINSLIFLWLMIICGFVFVGNLTAYAQDVIKITLEVSLTKDILQHDKFGREVTFYLSETNSKNPLPLIVFIQGSGCASLFNKQGERIVPTS